VPFFSVVFFGVFAFLTTSQYQGLAKVKNTCQKKKILLPLKCAENYLVPDVAKKSKTAHADMRELCANFFFLEKVCSIKFEAIQ
jgi:hypothetical protein